ncbi:MAG: hypothetical protein IBJ00_01585 [Alphaproteobacteria bacterium]|nr:hypothetical protein [Alphaproteobacteria bacterium]
MKNRQRDFKELIKISNEKQADVAFEQYKMLVESLNKINEVRELANTFWMTANSLIISAIAYLISAKELTQQHKPTLVWTLLGLGFLLAALWLRSLTFVKKSVDLRNFFLIEFEKYLPAKIFTQSIQGTERHKNKTSLTLNEALVPCLFLVGYIFFSILLFTFQGEIIPPK